MHGILLILLRGVRVIISLPPFCPLWRSRAHSLWRVKEAGALLPTASPMQGIEMITLPVPCSPWAHTRPSFTRFPYFSSVFLYFLSYLHLPLPRYYSQRYRWRQFSRSGVIKRLHCCFPSASHPWSCPQDSRFSWARTPPENASLCRRTKLLKLQAYMTATAIVSQLHLGLFWLCPRLTLPRTGTQTRFDKQLTRRDYLG
ncbi:hypothetical protein QBC46DRAFT_48928 [Diplogelasinospora grovesii]|uniref:Secreted protein n=1 Tax=Diplogelasinospora grovesii TaxID=303347 RepID=A0AAN6S7Z0_9PEZI|nr:hypothetical protein QBC46DRAFT_48928 [Diplogelasinospora grovesii]